MKIGNRKFLVVSALCGGMGVLSGYAIYLTYQQVKNDSAEHAPARFLLTLLITAVISYGIEWIREVIREGKIEHATHPIFRTMGTFIIVLMFELFIIGFHNSLDLSMNALRGVSNLLLDPKATDPSPNLTLVLAAGLWIVVGALLAAWLSQSVKDSSGTTWDRIVRAGRVGIIGGLIFAPVVMALYIFGDRCLVAILDVIQQYRFSPGAGIYQDPLSTFLHNMFVSQNTLFKGWVSSAFLLCVTLPLTVLATAAQKSVWLFMACYFAMAAFVGWYPAARKLKALRNRAMRIALWAIWVLLLVYTVGPFGYAVFRVAHQLASKHALLTLGAIVLSAAVSWAVPGGLLGALTPLLRRAAAHTRNWAFVGYGSALLLIVATLWVRAWWALIPALAALAVGYMFQRGSLVYEYWPFAALCVAVGICGATSIAQHMTFADEVVNLHAIDELQPAPANQPAVASLIKLFDEASPAEQAEAEAQNSGDSGIALIHAPDGGYELVAERRMDAEKVKELQKFWNDNAAEIERLNDLAVGHAAQPVMPKAKDLPPRNKWIDGAITKLNNPDAAAEPAPATAAPTSSDATAPPATTQATQTAQANSTNQQTTASSQAEVDAQSDARRAEAAAKALELSLSGSVGFWVTIGLLACWSMHDEEELEEQAHAN
jgi:hypothetical protein